MEVLAMVLVAGILFCAGDVVARKWADKFSLMWFGIMVVTATIAYSVFGWLTRRADLSVVAIWVSLSLTSFTCLYGIVVLGEPIKDTKVIAFILALAAAYLAAL